MKPRTPFMLSVFASLLLLSLATQSAVAQAAQAAQETYDVKAHYTKLETRITMRDGVKLFTSIYLPKDPSQKYPIIMQRTPYSVAPYGPDNYKTLLGPSPLLMRDGYIFVYQDVRGRNLSEGDFKWMTPYKPKKSGNEVDESTDTYDTIEWLIKNLPNNNGRVGMWGISYPGFYVAAALHDPHPALTCASPQAPIADWFLGDDDHHNGAFFVFDSFTFNQFFGMPRPQPTANQFRNFDMTPNDAWQFFLNLGPVANAQQQYFKGQNKYWNDVMQHGTYDEFWQARNVLPHLNKVTPAVLTVGGWFDAEDLYGPLHIYQTIEKNNPRTVNNLVMGPWCHGCWANGPGNALGSISFEANTSEWYREKVELPFFNFHLKGKGELKLPEAWAFRTGANEWKSFDEWPPKNAEPRNLYFQPNGRLSFDAPTATNESFDEYLSDPQRPVPYSNTISEERGTTYMIEDQRFAARRPDVLLYESAPLSADVTLAGPLTADLFIATTGTDADFIVKLIDVYPDTEPDQQLAGRTIRMGGFQMLVRGEVMRAKFRHSFSRPEPLTPNKPQEVKFALQDVHHTFRAGHKIMVQVQSSWFPLVDRNPQKFVDIYHATAADFQKATQRIYHSARLSSHLKVGVLK